MARSGSVRRQLGQCDHPTATDRRTHCTRRTVCLHVSVGGASKASSPGPGAAEGEERVEDGAGGSHSIGRRSACRRRRRGWWSLGGRAVCRSRSRRGRPKCRDNFGRGGKRFEGILCRWLLSGRPAGAAGATVAALHAGCFGGT